MNANMKVVAGIGTFLFFGEDAKWCQIVGFVLIFFALLLMVADKRNKHLKSLNHIYVKMERISMGSHCLLHKRDRNSSVGSEDHLLEDDVEVGSEDHFLEDDVDDDGYDLRLSITSV
jgi:hypothetical protein